MMAHLRKERSYESASLPNPKSVRGSFSSFSSINVKPLEPTQKDKKLDSSESKLKESQELGVEIGWVTQEGLYHENEDRIAFGVNLNEQIEGFVGIFDGHGGEDCADFVSTELSKYLGNFFKAEGDWDAGDARMKEMFHKIEEDFIELAVEADDTSGSCATIVIVKNSEALVANIGDCKAIAIPDFNDDKFNILTGDHRADAEDELERINKAGGSVIEGRVCNLQPSRSFGDLDVKEVVGEGVVIPTPEVSRITMRSGGFMIIATDGLWDSAGEEDVIKKAKDELKASNFDPQIVANSLVRYAVEENSTDDITVSVIVWGET